MAVVQWLSPTTPDKGGPPWQPATHLTTSSTACVEAPRYRYRPARCRKALEGGCRAPRRLLDALRLLPERSAAGREPAARPAVRLQAGGHGDVRRPGGVGAPQVPASTRPRGDGRPRRGDVEAREAAEMSGFLTSRSPATTGPWRPSSRREIGGRQQRHLSLRQLHARPQSGRSAHGRPGSLRSVVRGHTAHLHRNPTSGGDMRIWWRRPHGDGSPFDGASGVLAHCFYPPPNGGDIAGDATSTRPRRGR